MVQNIGEKENTLMNKSDEEIKNNEEFWNATIDDIKNGYIQSDDSIKCLICGENFTIGKIYKIDSEFYEAKKAAEIHIGEKHNSMLQYLLNMNSSFTGISEVHREIINLFSQGLSDKEISNKLGVATSTIRNHRYKLREKEKQAKLYLAIMDLLAQSTNKKINKLDKGTICDAHKTATTLDDRFNITDEEKIAVIENYMDKSRVLKSYPSREKKKIIVLEEIMKKFESSVIYSEKEINEILKTVYDDFATIRRALIEYGFLSRSNDCRSYWVKE